MNTGKPIRVRLLLWSAYVNCILNLIFLFALGIQFLNGKSAVSLLTFFTILIFVSFFLNGGISIHLIRRYYPSYDVPRGQRILQGTITVIVCLILLLILLGIVGIFINQELNRGFIQNLKDPIVLSTFSSLTLVILCQVHILFEGHWLRRTITKNFRNSLIDSL
jgi:hypothetical protein